MAAAKKKEPLTPHPIEQMFEYKTQAGTIRIPYIENLPLAVIEDGQGMNVDQFIKNAWEHLMDEEQTNIRRAMTLTQYREMLEKWDAESHVSLGELFS